MVEFQEIQLTALADAKIARVTGPAAVGITEVVDSPDALHPLHSASCELKGIMNAIKLNNDSHTVNKISY